MIKLSDIYGLGTPVNGGLTGGTGSMQPTRFGINPPVYRAPVDPGFGSPIRPPQPAPIDPGFGSPIRPIQPAPIDPGFGGPIRPIPDGPPQPIGVPDPSKGYGTAPLGGVGLPVSGGNSLMNIYRGGRFNIA